MLFLLPIDMARIKSAVHNFIVKYNIPYSASAATVLTALGHLILTFPTL